MKHKPFFLFAVLISFLCIGNANAKTIDLKSPNGEIKVTVEVTDKISYSINYGNDLILDNCLLQMDLGTEVLGVDPKLKKTKRYAIQEEIRREIPLRTAIVKNDCEVLLLTFRNDYSVEFRAFNDGVAYRFITNKKGDVEVKGETFQINFPETYTAHLSKTGSFKTSYENPYSHVKTTDYKASDKMTTLPVLLSTDKSYKILISEADLSDYPCMFLKSTGNNGMESLFPPVPLEFGEDGDRSLKILKEADYIAKTSGSRSFPWRVFVISKEDKQIIENQLVFCLSRPNELPETDWIKPGQVSWEWWHDARLYGVDFRSGYNMDSYKYYIDFASKFGIPYIIMDEGWAKSTRDPFTPNPTIDLQELIRYGKSKNVKIVLWLTWLTVENHFDLFKTFSDWGIAGVKIDFMDRSDQWMVNYYERVAKEAAKHHLFVDFHGAFKPAGLERRYPNILSYEGVLGMEQGGRCTPENSIYLPFIRNAVGPMDFTPGSMLSAQPEDNRYTRANAMGSGTRAFQMALFVVFESGLQMLADNPVYYYREKECTDFISSVPVTWDELKVLHAEVGKSVVLARRHGDKWFIGAIAGNQPTEVTVSLDFLNEGKNYQFTYFQDGINADRQAMDYKKHSSTAKKGDTVTIHTVRNGGWAAVLE
ncbi:glycoside hydrolase family 97 protein [Parabacteroides pacaensis]|uniref:glycoside hydrolase family 97 protein n=1 Tax=Parabacteroides pacaensis TaxID=2086575 RepID=UPI000D0EE9B3|nr:glycoside hydrolase family 97 protein [Parabacteroides pacaensis]